MEKNKIEVKKLIFEFITVLFVFSIVSTVYAQSVNLGWNEVTTSTDGTVITDIAGYEIHYNVTATSLQNGSPVIDGGDNSNTVLVISLDDPGLIVNAGTPTTPKTLEYSISNLPAGQLFFAVKAYDSSGYRSDFSNILGATAVFLSEPVIGVLPLEVNFTDLSLPSLGAGIISWAWDFGDGSLNTSTVKNPTYTYAATGKYSVSLTVTDSFGSKNTSIQTYNILNDSLTQVTHAITVTSSSGGVISPDTTNVYEGADKAFDITPNIDYKVIDVTVDSISMGAIPVYSFSGVLAPHSISATFDLIIPLNRPPSISVLPDQINSEVLEGSTITITVNAADDDILDILTITYTGAPEGSIFENTGDRTATLIWTPDFNVCTPALVACPQPPISFTVTDRSGETATSNSIVITVLNNNLDPVISDTVPGASEVAIMEGESQTFSVTATDPGNDILSYTWKVNGEVQLSTLSSMTYSPGYNTTDTPYVDVVVEVTVSNSKASVSPDNPWAVKVEDVMKGDVVTDRFIDFKDLSSFMYSWNSGDSTVFPPCTSVTDPNFNELLNFNDTEDCFIDFTDLSDFINMWNAGVQAISPHGREILSGTQKISWNVKSNVTGASLSGSDLTVNILLSGDNGATWTVIPEGTGVNGSDNQILWNTVTALSPDGTEYLVKVTATDTLGLNTFDKYDISNSTFSVANSENLNIAAFEALFNQDFSSGFTALANDPYISEFLSMDLIPEGDTKVRADIFLNGVTDLHSVNIKIKYVPELIQVKGEGNIVKGPLLAKMATDINPDVFISTFDDITGTVEISTGLLGRDAGTNEGGMIAGVTFEIQKAGAVITTSDIGISNLNLRNSLNVSLITVEEVGGGAEANPISASEPTDPPLETSDSGSEACFIGSVINH